MEPNIDRSLAERTSRQLGLVSRTQAKAFGLTPRMQRTRIANESLAPLGTRVLGVSGSPPSWERDVMAACLDTNGVASHRTAAVIHELEGFTKSSHPMIEVSVRSRRQNSQSVLAAVHTSTALGPDDVVAVGCIPTTTVARTVLGLAALVPIVDIESVAAAVDAAVRDGRATDRWLWWRLEQLRCRGRNGVTVMEAILQDRAGVGRTESWLERETLKVLHAGGLALPACQRRLSRRGGFAARVDFLYEAERVVIEVDGHGGHSTKQQRSKDAERANRLQLQGYRLLRFTYDDVVRRPGFVVTVVREALGLLEAA
ncbi:MAG: DUF559 domain-containing protein [Acidimicrobiales bacterium]